MMMLFAFFLPLWPTKLLGNNAFKVGKIPEFLFLNPLLTAWNSLTFASGKLRRCFSLTSLSLFPEGKQPQMLVVRVPTLFYFFFTKSSYICWRIQWVHLDVLSDLVLISFFGQLLVLDVVRMLQDLGPRDQFGLSIFFESGSGSVRINFYVKRSDPNPTQLCRSIFRKLFIHTYKRSRNSWRWLDNVQVTVFECWSWFLNNVPCFCLAKDSVTSWKKDVV